MKVALMAQDSKKKLMQNLCVAYRSIMMKHELYATGTTGRLIEEASGLNVRKSLAGQIGGEEQIGAMIDQNQIDLVIFFRDPAGPRSREQDVNKVIRLCDMHNVPLATNIGTAELLLKSLDRGDLDWREMYR
jgi:methylglyoxal synthase